MTSSALFISDAESTVTFGPMLHVGWSSVSSTVACSTRSAGHVRNGPPDAVSTSLLTSLERPACRHWKIALCSESTGRRCTPRFRTSGMTRTPAATSVSLFASAMSQPFSIAAIVAGSPAEPTIAADSGEDFRDGAHCVSRIGARRVFGQRERDA